VAKIITCGIILCAVIHLAGCWFVPVPLDTPAEFTQSKEKLNSLVGSNGTAVIKTLGQPEWIIPSDSLKTQYVYQWWSKDYHWMWVGYWPSPLVTSGDSYQPHCILLDFEDDILKGYKIETAHSPNNCLTVLFLLPSQTIFRPQWESNNPEILQTMADEADVEAQFRLYSLNEENGKNIQNLCHLADQGHTKSQKEIARIYWRRNDIKDNKSKSYMWYTIASATNFGGGRYHNQSAQKSAIIEVEYKRTHVLTDEQLRIALYLLSQWQPGQCELDFTVSSSGKWEFKPES
jgi:hypothetical protein